MSPKLSLFPGMKPWQNYSALKAELQIKALSLFSKSLLWILSAASEPHPLFSASVATAIIVFLYLPRSLLLIFISPVIVSTLFLLLTLLHFGSQPPHPPESDLGHVIFSVDTAPETEKLLASSIQKPFFCEPMVEWGGWRGPLEIIYEEYEEEGEEDGDRSSENSTLGWRGLEGLEGFCYSDVDMEGEESPESFGFRWDEEGDDLIEISLEGDNLFEINLSSTA